MFHVASDDEIRSGLITDIYFKRAVEVLHAKNIDRLVRAEFIAKGLPDGWPWAVLGGVEECAHLMRGVGCSVRAMPEGTLFHTFEPVMEVEGPYTAFALYETALLGLICQASGIATRAARCKKAAGHRLLASFGARRMHPALAPMIERAAYIGGCDGTSVIASAEMIGERATGTMPHALIICFGSTVEATKAFHEVMLPDVPRVSLIDTFNDEKFEALNVAEALGNNLFAVRLDTPGSRRGNFRQLLEEVRWELDLRGHGHVKLFVSGGIGENEIHELNDVVDAYGVGTWISNAPVVDFAMDIIEVEGRPFAKRGKMSGAKSVWRCHSCWQDATTPLGVVPDKACGCGGEYEELLRPLTKAGEVVAPLPPARAIRGYVMEQMQRFEL